jgi:protoporphyrinogen oxidase
MLEVVSMVKSVPVVVIGGGPAGLTAAYELAKQGQKTVVFEQGSMVGGIARTEEYKGYRFDIGGHRFFTKVEIVQKLWYEVLGSDFIKVPRLSRIYYDGKFFSYPLQIKDTLANLGIGESLRIMLSYAKIKVRPCDKEETLEEWVTNRFGRRLFRTFFKTYTEKVWGIECDKIEADWAAQRIKGLSLRSAVMNAMFNVNNTKTLIKEFDYPRLGPGMMWERFAEAIAQREGEVHLNAGVVRLSRTENHIDSITVRQNGDTREVTGEQFISSMPVTALVQRLDPPAPEHVLKASRSLNYRAFIIVPLVINDPHLFPDNWIYIHSPEVTVGRIQNFKNWSPEMVPDASKTCLGMEYFCDEGDALWNMSDTELLDLATKEVAQLGLAKAESVEDGCVIRQPKAYPVYDRDYRNHLQVIQDYLDQFDNLQTTGRNGMHRYNNQDHSMLTGYFAARNLMGESHDLWDVNAERSYHESFSKEQWNGKEEAEKAVVS